MPVSSNPSVEVAIDPESLSRLPALRPESLTEAGKRFHDAVVNARPKLLAGFQGPSGIWMHMPKIGLLLQEINRELRENSGLDKRLVELAILVTAREMNSQFEWAAHEAVALRAGLAADTIDIVRRRKASDALPAIDAAIIEVGREVFRTGRVSDATYAGALAALGQGGLVSIAALFSNYALTAVMLGVFDQQLQPSQQALMPMD